jgi:3-methyladenine DNA glycosylase AlkD
MVEPTATALEHRVAALCRNIRRSATEARAASEAEYLRSSLVHWGVAVPQIRAAVKLSIRQTPIDDSSELRAFADALWQHDMADAVHERRMAAVILLCARPTLIGVDDLPWIERLLRSCATWALLDDLARHLVAGIVQRDAAGLITLDRWVADDDFWIRRSAVLGLSYLLRDGAEIDRFVRYADALLHEREFFIRKVLGWVARDTGVRHPGPISDWVRANLHRMSGVTIREAVKYLPDGDELLAGWKAIAARGR